MSTLTKRRSFYVGPNQFNRQKLKTQFMTGFEPTTLGFLSSCYTKYLRTANCISTFIDSFGSKALYHFQMFCFNQIALLSNTRNCFRLSPNPHISQQTLSLTLIFFPDIVDIATLEWEGKSDESTTVTPVMPGCVSTPAR